MRLVDVVPDRRIGEMDSLSPVAPFRIVNIGNGAPVGLMDFVSAVEAAVGRTATRRLLPMQPGDVPATWADTTLIEALTGPLPRTDIRDGVKVDQKCLGFVAVRVNNGGLHAMRSFGL